MYRDHTTQSQVAYSLQWLCVLLHREQSYALPLWIKTSIFQQTLQI
jgi:hypothetical protein